MSDLLPPINIRFQNLLKAIRLKQAVGVVNKPINITAPFITGLTEQGATLTGNIGVFSGAVSYVTAFLRDGVIIPGASGATYIQTAADLTKMIKFEVNAINTLGSTKVQSVAVGPVTALGIAPEITSTGTFSVDENVVFGGTVTATGTAPITFGKIGPDAGLVTLNTTTGTWSLPGQDFETKPNVNFSFTATNASGVDTEAVIVTINNVADGPVLSPGKTPPLLTLEGYDGNNAPIIGAEIDSTHSVGDKIRYYVTDRSGVLAPALIVHTITSANTTAGTAIPVGFASYISGSFDVEANILNAAETLYSALSNKIAFGPPAAILSAPNAISVSTTAVDVDVTTNSNTGNLYGVSTATNVQPSDATILAGQSLAVASVGVKTLSFTGLPTQTMRYFWILQFNSAGKSNIVTASAIPGAAIGQFQEEAGAGKSALANVSADGMTVTMQDTGGGRRGVLVPYVMPEKSHWELEIKAIPVGSSLSGGICDAAQSFALDINIGSAPQFGFNMNARQPFGNDDTSQNSTSAPWAQGIGAGPKLVGDFIIFEYNKTSKTISLWYKRPGGAVHFAGNFVLTEFPADPRVWAGGNMAGISMELNTGQKAWQSAPTANFVGF